MVRKGGSPKYEEWVVNNKMGIHAIRKCKKCGLKYPASPWAPFNSTFTESNWSPLAAHEEQCTGREDYIPDEEEGETLSAVEKQHLNKSFEYLNDKLLRELFEFGIEQHNRDPENTADLKDWVYFVDGLDSNDFQTHFPDGIKLSQASACMDELNNL